MTAPRPRRRRALSCGICVLPAAGRTRGCCRLRWRRRVRRAGGRAGRGKGKVGASGGCAGAGGGCGEARGPAWRTRFKRARARPRSTTAVLTESGLRAISDHCRHLTALEVAGLSPDPEPPGERRASDDAAASDAHPDLGGREPDLGDYDSDCDAGGYGGGYHELGASSGAGSGYGADQAGPVAAPAPAAPLLSADLCRGLSRLCLDWIKAEPAGVQAPLAAALAACRGLRRLSLEGYQGAMEEVRARLPPLAGAPLNARCSAKARCSAPRCGARRPPRRTRFLYLNPWVCASPPTNRPSPPSLPAAPFGPRLGRRAAAVRAPRAHAVRRRRARAARRRVRPNFDRGAAGLLPARAARGRARAGGAAAARDAGSIPGGGQGSDCLGRKVLGWPCRYT